MLVNLKQMKRLLTLFILVICIRGLQSCAPSQQLTLKGNYLTEPYTFNSDKPKQQVWDNLIDIVAQTGIGFTTLDKENGLLISKEYSFQGSVTTEDKAGKIRDSSAWIVVNSRYWNVTKEYDYPKNITGVLTIRIRENGNGSTGSINLTNVKAYHNTTGQVIQSDVYQVRSTGVFERKIMEKLK